MYNLEFKKKMPGDYQQLLLRTTIFPPFLLPYTSSAGFVAPQVFRMAIVHHDNSSRVQMFSRKPGKEVKGVEYSIRRTVSKRLVLNTPRSISLLLKTNKSKHGETPRSCFAL